MATTTRKPLDWFKVKSNVRKRFGDEEELRRLGKSLRTRQLQALVCLPDGTIVCGERRYRGALLEGLDFLEVKIIDDPVSEAEYDRSQLVENLSRLDLTNAEKCAGCCQYAARNPDKSNKEIAGELHVDPSLVTRWRAWEKAIAAVRQALADERIGLNDMYGISQLPEEEQRHALELTLAGTEAGQARRQVRQAANGAKPGVRVNRIKVPVPGMNVTVAITGDALSLDDGVAAVTELLRQMKKGAAQGWDGKTFEKVCKDEWKRQAKACGTPADGIPA
jgi:ParB/RepB/Spo0J family partition protein